MNLAPLQLLDYFVHTIRVEALTTFDPEKEKDLDLDSLEVRENCFQIEEGSPNRFAVDLVIEQPAVEGKNLPYTYELHMVAFVEAHPDFPPDNLQRMVETNGPSMLFSAAREILRTATGRGPYGPLMIPSTTFYKPETETKKKKSKSASKKKTTRKKTK